MRKLKKRNNALVRIVCTGYYGSMRALTVAVGPYIFGNLYAWGRKAVTNAAGRPRFNFGFMAAALLGCVVPEFFHQLLLISRRNDKKDKAALAAESEKYDNDDTSGAGKKPAAGELSLEPAGSADDAGGAVKAAATPK
jgi:hypothetical protein